MQYRVKPLAVTLAASLAFTGAWADVELSGLVELEAGHTDSLGGSESDLAVSAVELGLDAQVASRVNAHALIVFDESEPPELDEAFMVIANPDALPFALMAGRLYVPFGHFDSALIADPLTLEIGETRETAVQLGYDAGNFHAQAYVFNGITSDGGSESIDGFGLALDYALDAEGDNPGIDIGLSWISNLADSGGLQGAVTDPDNLLDTVAGLSAHAAIHWQAFTLAGQYLSAADDFDAADLDFNGAGARPAAWNLELDYRFEITGREAEAAIALQQTGEALRLGLPEKRWLMALSLGIHDQTVLALEYAHDEDYSVADGGSGEDTDTITLQLAVAF